MTARIRRLFIANRGEIAARIRRTADALGIEVVVPDVDGPSAVDLLDPDGLVEAAVVSGCDALHPGYGFLSENASFAAAIEAAGVRWVGPPPRAMSAMGDKAGARRLAASLGVPVVPGYDDADQGDERLAEAAEAIAYPVLVKPAAGGGGKGMRRVDAREALPEALAAARREAGAAFGDDRLIVERLIEGPRHVEVQVLFDAHGGGVHLGERDCSLQRRHQKVLEESPSPAVDDALRARMTGAALRLASAVGYRSAGTLEFLVDDRGQFWFLEMNTRLQVEHPVTEAVTGRDLVADQLRIATGEPLGFAQGDVRFEGHAIEVRLYAEDAEAGFLPAAGRVVAAHWPAGPGIRVDAGVAVGDDVTGRFDPMLAKIIAHGRDRAEALDRLALALEDTVVLGVVTNLRFLRAMVRDPTVRAGEVRIDSLDRIWEPEPLGPVPNTLLAGATERLLEAMPESPWAGGWRLNAPRTVRLEVDGEPGRDGKTVFVDDAGRSRAVRLAPPPDVERAAHAATRAGSFAVSSPMPGRVLAVHVAEGALVEGGDPIATLEAMKMEHVVTAPSRGRVADLDVRVGDQVTRDQLLARVEQGAGTL